MAVDKDKVAKNALRFIQRGQFQKAIDEYRKVLSTDPRDIRTRLKLVDLYGRIGKKREAIDECLQVADSYSDQGFYLKAIAVYKQALRVDPENPRLHRSMGELYVKQGLLGDALGVFKRGVDLLRQAGQTAEAEEVLSRMEEMAPDNVAIKVHLAELYLADGRMPAFEREFEKIVLQLKGEGRARKLLQAMEGFYEKSNRHISVLKRLAELYADLNEDERALEIVRHGLAQNPADRDLRLLALRAYLMLGNQQEARRMALGLLDEDPDDLFILEQLVGIAQARGDRSELSQAHKALAKAYGRKGLAQKEELHYGKVLELSPDDAEARLAVGDLVVQAAPRAAARKAPKAPEGEILEIESFWTDETPPAAKGTDTIREGLTEADLYLKYGMEDKAAQKLEELSRAAPEDIEIRKKLRDLCQRRGDRDGWLREQLRIADLHLRQGKDNEALRTYQAVLEVAPDSADARKAIQYLKPDAIPATRPSSSVSVELGVGTTIEFAEGGGGERALRADTGGEPDAATLQEGLAEADFYVAQELNDEALAALLRLRQQHGAAPAITSRLERLGWKEAEEQGEDFVDLQADVLDASGTVFSIDKGTFQDFEITELDDIVREFKSGIAEKLEEGDHETHYNLGTAYKEMGLLEDAIQEFQIAARSSERGREAYTSISMVFREMGKLEDARSALRMALAVPTNTAEDRAAILYEMGVVSREAEDWGGALQAFEKAAATIPSFRDVGRQIQSLKSRH